MLMHSSLAVFIYLFVNLESITRQIAVVQITYKGSGNVRNTQVVISWPYELQSIHASGKHLLYLTQLPEASCVSSLSVSY